MFKKTAIAALVLGFSGAASAAMYAPAAAPACSAGNVTVPCEGNAYDFGADLLYLRAEDSVVSSHNYSDTYNSVRGKRGYGFRVEGSYHFGTGNDLNVNWSRFSKSQTGVFYPTAATDRFKAKLDVVNIELGQHIDVGEMWDIRAHMGLQHANVRNVVDDNISDTTDGDHTWKVAGWGPRAGFDSMYDFGNGFGVFGNLGVSMLQAKATFDTETAADAREFHSVVTHVDTRLGVMYTHAMAQGDLMVHAGYQANNFINAGQNINDGGALSSNTGLEKDLSFDGWFVGFKWVGNA